MDYKISSRDYLERARLRLDDGGFDSLFYAALELRCGIEARMQEYLEAQKSVSKKLKKGWQITKLRKGLEEAFNNHEKIIQIKFFKPEEKPPFLTLFYTPITPKLQKQGEKLGNYLHSMKKIKKSSDVYWENLRRELEIIYIELKKANYGTLLGPPMINKKTQVVDLNQEFPGPRETAVRVIEEIKKKMIIGSKIKFYVEYLTKLPEEAS